jgi:hypothetical protein
MFEAADELHDGADWFTAAVTHLLGPTTPPHRRRRPPSDGRHRHRDARAAADSDPQALIASIEKLSQEVEARRASLSRPRMTCALFWNPDEFAQLLGAWPELADHYGTEYDEHVRHIEQMLQRLSGEG